MSRVLAPMRCSTSVQEFDGAAGADDTPAPVVKVVRAVHACSRLRASTSAWIRFSRRLSVMSIRRPMYFPSGVGIRCSWHMLRRFTMSWASWLAEHSSVGGLSSMQVMGVVSGGVEISRWCAERLPLLRRACQEQGWLDQAQQARAARVREGVAVPGERPPGLRSSIPGWQLTTFCLSAEEAATSATTSLGSTWTRRSVARTGPTTPIATNGGSTTRRGREKGTDPMRLLFVILLIGAAVVLAGCGTMNLDNRVACTVAKDKGFVVSEWGPVGVSSELATQDAAVICK